MMNQQFYQVLRIFFKNEQAARSVEFFDEYNDAEIRYYAIIASDIANPQIEYHSAYIIDAYGCVKEHKVFDRRDFSEPEPEPEPTPEPEEEPEPEEVPGDGE